MHAWMGCRCPESLVLFIDPHDHLIPEESLGLFELSFKTFRRRLTINLYSGSFFKTNKDEPRFSQTELESEGFVTSKFSGWRANLHHITL